MLHDTPTSYNDLATIIRQIAYIGQRSFKKVRVYEPLQVRRIRLDEVRIKVDLPGNVHACMRGLHPATTQTSVKQTAC
jgi:hypothetical protein